VLSDLETTMGAVCAMTWLDVLLKHWSHLSEELQEKVRQHYHLQAAAQQLGGRFLPEMVRTLEQELQAEARKLGWVGGP
jgi:hypothetical protein